MERLPRLGVRRLAALLGHGSSTAVTVGVAGVLGVGVAAGVLVTGSSPSQPLPEPVVVDADPGLPSDEEPVGGWVTPPTVSTVVTPEGAPVPEQTAPDGAAPPTASPLDEVPDTLDEVGDALDDVPDAGDELVEDVVEDVEDVIDGVEDVTDALDEVTVPSNGATAEEATRDPVQDATDLVP
jgi:hypothetical protein